MPSVIQRCEYDNLISFRNNNNRSGWVTEFVNALEEVAANQHCKICFFFLALHQNLNMYSDSKKIQLIEEVLRLNNSVVLKELESVLKKSRKTVIAKKGTAHDLLGQWSKPDAELIEKAIADGCKQINADEWR